MANRSGRQNRKAALAVWKAEQRAAARAKFPLPAAARSALFDDSTRGCPAAAATTRSGW
ncbi:hypothetical protein [Frigoriglobus tundricola]|uniref:Uncharacterized protein n=1 Tax=Frigoriglobus tundricola TaxID=2774151 RepID=A0A6M5YKH1_9BACT|nr:hypothetical protein [Frigoriglobus tundricola]QJW93801.1 hypothetical protein FTUN_1312 [Frigoriglobus tundricola]